jgi:protein TonB
VKKATIIISLLIHAGAGVALVGAARETNRRKAIAVAVAEARKKAEPKKPPPPPPPKPKKIAPKVVAAAPKPAAVNAAPKAAPAPKVAAQTALSMSNDDAPGGDGIALGGPAAGGGPSVPGAAAAAPAKVASAVSSSRTRRTREALGDGPKGEGEGAAGDAPCTEDPTKPVPVYKTEIEYTAAARAEGVEGKLKIRIIVGADGSVSDVEVLSSVEPALDAAAIAAAKLWRFKPAMACGKPVAGGTYIFSQRFELTD